MSTEQFLVVCLTTRGKVYDYKTLVGKTDVHQMYSILCCLLSKNKKRKMNILALSYYGKIFEAKKVPLNIPRSFRP